MDDIVAAHPVHLKAGDAIFFVDCLAHGAEERKNPGTRDVSILRYGPKWSLPEKGRFPSKAFLEQTTDARRQLLEPVDVHRFDDEQL
jgi:ectoine hydroxylase-related dioxygenase (phytanoyl-CoA dioxygenase family)